MTVEPNNFVESIKLNENALNDQPRVELERNIGTNSKGNILVVNNDAIVRNPTPITSTPVDLVSSKGPSSDSSSPNSMIRNPTPISSTPGDLVSSKRSSSESSSTINTSGSMNSPDQINDAKVEKAFEVIGMKRTFNMDAIKKQFRRAILMQHPDK
ncbi:hypothetical protein ROZALSC1DRAFT_26405, partial [Rozella allomycis CSF55]